MTRELSPNNPRDIDFSTWNHATLARFAADVYRQYKMLLVAHESGGCSGADCTLCPEKQKDASTTALP